MQRDRAHRVFKLSIGALINPWAILAISLLGKREIKRVLCESNHLQVSNFLQCLIDIFDNGGVARKMNNADRPPLIDFSTIADDIQNLLSKLSLSAGHASAEGDPPPFPTWIGFFS